MQRLLDPVEDVPGGAGGRRVLAGDRHSVPSARRRYLLEARIGQVHPGENHAATVSREDSRNSIVTVPRVDERDPTGDGNAGIFEGGGSEGQETVTVR